MEQLVRSDRLAFSVHGLVYCLGEHPAFAELLAAVRDAACGPARSALNLPEPARPLVLAALAQHLDQPILWITAEADEARAAADALRAYMRDRERVYLFPAPDVLPYERAPWDPTSRELRLAALMALHNWPSGGGAPPLIVAPLRAVLLYTLSKAELAAKVRTIAVGQRVDLWAFLREMGAMGYAPVQQVSEMGQVAHRGGIVDLFPPGLAMPIRIEWFGDELCSLRSFDPVSQRSEREIDQLLIGPASEALPDRGPEVAQQLERLDVRRLHPLADSELERHRAHLAAAQSFPGIEFYGPLLHPGRCCLVDHLPEASWVVADNFAWLSRAAEDHTAQAESLRQEQVDRGELPTDWPAQPYCDWALIAQSLDRHRQLALGYEGPPVTDERLGEAFASPPRFGGRIDDAVLEAARIADAGSAVVLLTRQSQRVAELLGELGIPLAPTSELAESPSSGGIAVVHGALAAGWTLRGGRCETVLLTDGELFGWRMPRSRRPLRRPEYARSIDYFSEYTPGDYVVHIEHGIGLFRGIQRLQLNGIERDYLAVEYAQGDMLYVPTNQADRVARYVGGGDNPPVVSRLGSADWDRARSRAQREIESIARELLQLYAQREVARRAPFLPDTAWQHELEAAFPYLETEDQLRAIEEVKRDMEGQRPMDRLVVGDVGFGKTEVAIRAAFKCVMAGRQVAVLAPTTVLAQQHYETFSSRLGAFPIRVAMLSRFLRSREQQEVVERVAAGDVDIVIGTHRLLSSDVHFHRLGLLIVDEEHRFGVRDKERIRVLRQDVDTLTLTATPIPRTMHLALSGLRDLTTISTPPEERLPVVTHVGPYDDVLVAQAIRRELQRRGQVFYVYNRVQGIEVKAQQISRQVPVARIGIAHGQMHEDDLARAMLEFVSGQVDVLVCTSIIESGLDIPNANTLIVERADRFGLAQLHQLRGRVGRGTQRAYAYLLLPVGYDLTEEARQRIEALASATDLGSGLRLAMHDLEIRGAGEILGTRQHGQVAAIGLDLYTRLLASAISRLRADAQAPLEDLDPELSHIGRGLPTVDLPLDAYLPESYVADTAERTRLYRRMAGAATEQVVAEIAAELADRFGQPPASVQNLLVILRLRALAHRAGATSIQRQGDAVAIAWPSNHELDRVALKAKLPPEARIGRHQVSMPLDGPPSEWLAKLERWLMVAIATEARTAAGSEGTDQR